MTRCLPLVIALAGCYQPELHDCTVSCSGSDRCPTGQECVDGRCAAAGASCEAPAAPDAQPDAHADLHVRVHGKGTIGIPALHAMCAGTDHSVGDCHFMVDDGTAVELMPMDPGHFDGWTTENCSAEPAACTVEVDAPSVLVEARYGSD